MIEKDITNISPLLSPIWDHIIVAGKATNWTIIKPIIIALFSRPRFLANVDARYTTVWTPSIYRKNASRKIKAFLYFCISLKVV